MPGGSSRRLHVAGAPAKEGDDEMKMTRGPHGQTPETSEIRRVLRALVGRITGPRGTRGVVGGAADGDFSDSWKNADVARMQKELVESELRNPERIAPFRTFLEILEYITRAYGPSKRRILDVGCGVGHYSELVQRYYSGRFEYLGCDYSEAMVETARQMWPQSVFLVDNVFESHVDYGEFDVIMASALVDVMENFWDVLDTLFDKTGNLLILHRQRITSGESYSTQAAGYAGQTTYASYINPRELRGRLRKKGLAVRKKFRVDRSIWSFLIERTVR